MTDYTIIDNWYKGYIPSFEGLLNFSIKSNILTKEVIETPLELDKDAETAYFENGKCVLPALFFVEEFYEKHLEIDKENRIKAAIAVINGSQIHESLHHKILGAKADFFYVLDSIVLSGYKIDDDHRTLAFKNCFNIIEDVYSNYLCSVEYPGVYPFVELLVKTMFNQAVFDRFYEKVYTDKNLINVFSILVCMQNDDNRVKDTQVLHDYQEHIEIILSARNVNLDLKERFFLAKRLYDLLKQEHDESFEFQDFTNNSSKNLSKNLDDNIYGFDSWEKISSDVEDDLSDIENDFYISIKTDRIEQIDVKFEDVKFLKKGSYSLKFDSKFNGFSQYIYNARAVKQIEVEPRYVGNKVLVNRLFMAESDGKIFGKKDTQILERNYPEIIFLLDCSGSMRGSGLILPVSSATMTIFKDLKENDISCAVYAHTTRYNDCYVVGVTSNKMPLMNTKQITSTHDYESRFNQLISIDTNQNADGFALDFVSKRFTENEGKKIVCVLSDGLPSFGYRYSDEPAENHIKNICENLRKSNISVVSLSLTSEVMGNNNRIYGVKNNIAAYGNNLQRNMKKLIENIVI